MASPARRGEPKTPPKRLRNYRRIAVGMLVFIGNAVLVTWLLDKPKRPVLTVEKGRVQHFELKDNQLNATFEFLFKLSNPSKGASVYYDSMKVYVLYGQEPIAIKVVKPFIQPYNNVTRFKVKPMAGSAPVSKDLRLNESSGEIEFEIQVTGKIHFKLASWKLKESNLSESCSLGLVPTSSSNKTFNSIDCHTNLSL